MLNCANTANQITENQNKNMCVLVALVVPLLTDQAIPPAAAMSLCSILRDGFDGGEGTPAWDEAIAELTPLRGAGVGQNTNQLESMQAQLIDLIAGPGTAPGVD